METHQIVFICCIQFKGEEHHIEFGRKPIVDIMQGFWLNERMELAEIGEEKWYIPGHRVQYIEKVA